MARSTWHPDWRTALPRVSFIRWSLFRLAMIAGVVFFGAAIMVPPPDCPALIPRSGFGLRRSISSCDPSWHIALRLEVAATGIVVALILAFLGARVDQLVVRTRRWRS